MEKIEWCKRQSKGIKLRRESVDLAKEYIENVEESLMILETIRGTRSNMWLATTKYYIEYFAVYAFLMRVGIKCKIHECTIEFVKLSLLAHFDYFLIYFEYIAMNIS